MMVTPANYVLSVFGNYRNLSEIVGRGLAAVHRWTTDKEVGGTGGLIPSASQVVILKYAKENGLDITAEDLILGRTIQTKEGEDVEEADNSFEKDKIQEGSSEDEDEEDKESSESFKDNGDALEDPDEIEEDEFEYLPEESEGYFD